MSSLNHRFLYKPKEAIKTLTSLRTLCCQKVVNYTNGRPRYRTLPPGNFIELNHSTRQYSKESNNSFKVLSESTMLVQDGVSIEELPVLIRRATRNSYPFTTHSYGGEKVCQETDFDNTFQVVLQSCMSVNEVFRLLEVPSDKVRGYSAAFALQRLHVLKHINTDWNQIHSFIRSAVMRELYDTVEKDIGLLSNMTLISLVDCYIAAEGFSPSCLDAINTEVQIRLGEGNFSVEELLTLACVLKFGTEQRKFKNPNPIFKPRPSTMGIVSENLSRYLSNEEQGLLEHFDKYCTKTTSQACEEIRQNCEELLKNVWVHLFTRYQEINAETLPSTLQALPVSYKSMLTFLEKPLNNVWVNLSAEGVIICLNNLLRLRANNSSIMTNLSRWAFVNVHKMTPSVMLAFLNTFLQFRFVEENVFKVMEKCLQLKGLQVQTNVIAMCVEYCRFSRYLSPVIMDVAAQHFTLYGYSYEPLQIYAVLRAFGQLNYLPSQPEAFLKMVESCLWERFDHLKETHLLEILASFTFLNIIPRNFVQRVVSDYYFAKVGKLRPPDKVLAVAWLKVMKNAIVMDTVIDRHKSLTWLMGNSNRRNSLSLYSDNYSGAVKSVKLALNKMFGPKFHYTLPIYACHTLSLDSNGVPVEVGLSSTGEMLNKEQVVKMLVILLRSADHFIVNTKQLLGVQVQRLAHLQKLGFIPIEIRVSDIMFADRNSETALVDVMKKYLHPHVNFHLVPEVCTEAANQVKPIFSEQSLNTWLGYNGGHMRPETEDSSSDVDLINTLLKIQTQMEPTDPDKPKMT